MITGSLGNLAGTGVTARSWPGRFLFRTGSYMTQQIHPASTDDYCQCLTCNLVRARRADLLHAPIKPNREERRRLEAENRTWPVELRQIPKSEWPPSRLPESKRPNEAWRSRDFLVSVYYQQDGVARLSINKTSFTGDRFDDGISWDDLQRLKRECGRGDQDAVEIFPADKDIVNVANMRHLFVLPEPFSLTWRKTKA